MSVPVVALDAMGGDRAPAEPVAGAVVAAREGTRVLLVGDEPTLTAELARHGGPVEGIEIRHAPDAIGSGEDGARAVRAKPESSLVVACKLVADGEAGGVVSAGNTGAMMAACTLILRRIPGVLRPAIAVVMPGPKGWVVLLDAGANAECRPEYYPQFALMGRLLARDILGIAEPRVGLLTIGEEEGKGNELVQEARELMEGSPGFYGNVEGRDIVGSTVDVVVTDGFTGNVALKVAEAAAALVVSELRTAAASSLRVKLGGLLMKPAFRTVKRKTDPEGAGGAYLLGVQGLAVIGHGNSSATAVANAIRLAARGIAEGTVERIRSGLSTTVS